MRPLALVFALCSLAGCSSDKGLSAFSSDGCSLFPDAAVIGPADWCSCCFDHDVAYWRGGTSAERIDADARLRDCVLSKTDNAALAEAMYHGVRVGGSPYFYNWYRWGYGWPFDRGYQPLSEAEQQTAARLLEEYREQSPENVCE